MNLKYQLHYGMINLNYLMDQIFNIILSIFPKTHKEEIDNPSIKTYLNKTANRITFKIKEGYYLELLIPETIKLFGSTGNKITKDENSESVPHLVLVHCNIVDNDYQQVSRVLYTFIPNKPFRSLLLKIAPTSFILLKIFNSEFQEIEVWFTDQDSQPL